jgi:hypothetical protein
MRETVLAEPLNAWRCGAGRAISGRSFLDGLGIIGAGVVIGVFAAFALARCHGKPSLWCQRSRPVHVCSRLTPDCYGSTFGMNWIKQEFARRP